MMLPLNDRADEVVAEMISLGAVFQTYNEDDWSWEPWPPVMRNAICRCLDSVAEVDCFGFQEAMVRAILRSTRGRQ